MDLTPRRIVADGDAGGEVDSTVGAFGAEINNFPAHHHRVRDGNDVIFAGENFGRQYANLADLTLIIGEADPVAFAQRPRVDQQQAAHRMGHHPG